MKKEKLPLLYWKCGLPTAQQAKGGHSKMNDVNSLSHSSWNYKCVVFASKYRRKVFFGEKRREIGSILRALCNWKGIKSIEAEMCPDHIHMLMEMPPKIAYRGSWGSWKERAAWCLREVSGTETQIPKSGILVLRVPRGHSRKKCKEDTGVYLTPVWARQSRRATDHAELLKSPFTGDK